MAYTVENTDNPCEECLLSGRSVDPRGSSDARFLVVTKPVSQSLVKSRSNISPGSLSVLSRHMQKYGFRPDEIVFTSSVRCAYDQTRWRAADRKHIEACCRQRLLKLIDRMQPEVIIPLGADAAKAVNGRAVKITKAAGVPVQNEEHECIVLPMVDPAVVHVRPEQEAVFDSDVRALAILLDHSYNVEDVGDAAVGDYTIVKDLQFLLDNRPTEMVLDVETVGTRYQEEDRKLLTIQLCVEPGTGFLIPWDHPDDPLPQPTKNKIKRQLRRLLQGGDIVIIGQGGKYDQQWVSSRLGIKFRLDHDTLMLAAMHDENLQRKDLDMLAKIYTESMGGYADYFNATYDKARMDLVPLDKIVKYGVGDADACLQVYHTVRPLVEADEKLWQNYLKVPMPGLNGFVELERGGVLVDPQALDRFEEELSVHVEDLRVSLIAQIPRAVKRDHVEKGLALTRQDFLRDILFTHPQGFRLRPVVFTKTTENLDPEFQVPSTSSKDHLPFFFDECPFAEELANYVKLNRLLGTNVRKFRENYILGDRVYPVYGLATAVTGRSNCRDPNASNFPNKGPVSKTYKRTFVAPERYYVIAGDLSQAEVRIAADMANERVMIELYNSGGDVHKRTARAVMGLTEAQFAALPRDEQKMARFRAKAVVFGYLYGMWWKKFKMYAKTQYGIDLTDNEARLWRTTFFDTYPSLEPWHVAMKSFAHEHGYVRSYDGRIRHLPMIWSQDESIVRQAERLAVNAPVQCFASNLGVMSIARMTQQVDLKYLKLFQFVHDAIYAYVPEKYVEWGAKTMKHYMQSNPIEEWFGRKMKVPIIADVGFGANAGDIVEMEDLRLNHPFEFDLAMEDAGIEYELPPQKIPSRRGRIVVPAYLDTGVS